MSTVGEKLYGKPRAEDDHMDAARLHGALKASHARTANMDEKGKASHEAFIDAMHQQMSQRFGPDMMKNLAEGGPSEMVPH